MKASHLAAAFLVGIFLSPSGQAQQPAQREAALDMLTSGDYAAAGAAYESLTRLNPYDGVLWYYRGRAELRSARCQDAIRSFTRALGYGVSGDRSGIRAALVSRAECYALQGDYSAALSDIGEAQARWDYSDFDRISENPAFAELVATNAYRQLVGIAAPGLNREQAWQVDIDFFVDMVERRHIHAFHTVSRDAWIAEAMSLRSRIAVSSDLELIGGLMRLAARLGDGHTAVFPPFGGPNAFRMAPLRPTILAGEWYVLAASGEAAELVGGRIRAINDVPITEYETLLDAYISSDNPLTYRASAPLLTQFTEIVALATNSEAPDRILYDVEMPNGEILRQSVMGSGLDPAMLRAWPPASMVNMADASDAPLWLSRPQDMLWMEYLPQSDLLYLQLDAIFDAPGLSFAQFVSDFGERLDETAAGHVVLDLRQNDGGDATRNWSLLREIVQRSRFAEAGRVFVITGRRTFSAAMILAARAEQSLDVTFVGSPTASSPNFYGETSVSVLPHSGLQLSVSSRYFQNGANSDDIRPWIAPDIVAELTAEDLFAGRDPAMDAIHRAIADRR